MEDKKNENQIPEIRDEELDKVSGGIQAGLLTDDSPQPPEETEEERKKRLMRQAEGSSFLWPAENGAFCNKKRENDGQNIKGAER